MVVVVRPCGLCLRGDLSASGDVGKRDATEKRMKRRGLKGEETPPRPTKARAWRSFLSFVSALAVPVCVHASSTSSSHQSSWLSCPIPSCAAYSFGAVCTLGAGGDDAAAVRWACDATSASRPQIRLMLMLMCVVSRPPKATRSRPRPILCPTRAALPSPLVVLPFRRDQ